MNLQEAADQLGVHYQTAYRWVRHGQLAASKLGVSYEVADSEVERFLSHRLSPTAPPERLLVRDWAVQRDRFYDAIVSGDEVDAREQLDRLLEGRVTALELCEELFAPCMRQIGEGWHAGEVRIGEEHRATAIVERILGRLASPPRGRPRGTALATTAPGDTHGLPSLMAAVVLRADRWKVHHLGADLPADEIVAMASDVLAQLVVVSATTGDADETLAELTARLQPLGARVLVGRPGLRLRDLVSAARGVEPADE